MSITTYVRFSFLCLRETFNPNMNRQALGRRDIPILTVDGMNMTYLFRNTIKDSQQLEKLFLLRNKKFGTFCPNSQFYLNICIYEKTARPLNGSLGVGHL